MQPNQPFACARSSRYMKRPPRAERCILTSGHLTPWRHIDARLAAIAELPTRLRNQNAFPILSSIATRPPTACIRRPQVQVSQCGDCCTVRSRLWLWVVIKEEIAALAAPWEMPTETLRCGKTCERVQRKICEFPTRLRLFRREDTKCTVYGAPRRQCLTWTFGFQPLLARCLGAHLLVCPGTAKHAFYHFKRSRSSDASCACRWCGSAHQHDEWAKPSTFPSHIFPIISSLPAGGR